MPKRTAAASAARAAVGSSLPLPLKRLLATACVLAVAAILLCGASEWTMAAGSGVDGSVTAQIRKWTAPPPPLMQQAETLWQSAAYVGAYSDAVDFCDGGSTAPGQRCTTINGESYSGPPACCDGADEEAEIRIRRGSL